MTGEKKDSFAGGRGFSVGLVHATAINQRLLPESWRPAGTYGSVEEGEGKERR